MNDQFSALDTPGIASDTLPGDHSTSGSVARQCSGSSIPARGGGAVVAAGGGTVADGAVVIGSSSGRVRG